VDEMTDRGWEVTRSGSTEVLLTVHVGPAPLVARMTRAELERASEVLDAAVRAHRSGEYSRIRLGTALRDALGRDPLMSVPAAARRAGRPMFPWWLDLAYLVIGLGFATDQENGWLRAAGFLFAALAAGDLAARPIRRYRRRLR
jgi:hypothetical protein